MIIVNLKGGLGNQMFQYAFGRRLALKNNDVLKLDVTGLERTYVTGDIYRSFGLGEFIIEKTLATPIEITTFKYPYGFLSQVLRWFQFKILRQTHSLFNPRELEQTGDLFLDGYWQSPRYFDEIRSTLLTDFTLRLPLSPAGATVAAQMKSTVSVSLHVRRGDYVKNPRVLAEFGICSLAYYQIAIAEITASHPNPTFFIFSDDIPWVKEHLNTGDNTVFVTDPTITDYQELTLMSRCAHNIIANSSFSWWGAWLNQNPNKLVTAPTPWFTTAPYDKNLIPASWIQIPK